MEDKREDKTITIDFPKGNFSFYCMIRNSHARVSGVLESRKHLHREGRWKLTCFATPSLG